ncbi:alanine racemase [Ktedonobacteria bacterium brp13]|nr:alanine racemase [Ktedonobacteria bacterium brp13]
MYQPRIGDELAVLDTPSLLVDLDLMEHNIALLQERLHRSHVQLRPHLKTAKCPEIAQILLAAGAIGGCVSKVSEAEVMAQAGIEDLLITSEVVGQPKINRLVQLVEQHPQIKVVVDSLDGAAALDQAFQLVQKPLDILIEIDVGQHRCGIEPGEVAVSFAQQLRQFRCLRLRGIQGYQGHVQLIADSDERERMCRQSMRALTSTVRLLREAGFPLEIVTTGGTGTVELCASYPEVTEVQPGSFLFIDAHYRRVLGPVYTPALTVVSTILSRPAPYRAIIDAGLKSLSIESGMAEPKDRDGLYYQPFGDEHGLLEWTQEVAARGMEQVLKVGDRLELIPSHCDTTINLFDTYYAHRKGKIEAIWSIAARGKVQ